MLDLNYQLFAYSETLLISLLYDKDISYLAPSYKPPPHCFYSTVQLLNQPQSALLAPLHMTDATDSHLPLLSWRFIDSSTTRIGLDTIIQQTGELE